MGFDYNSLLMASGAAGIALCFTLTSSWLRERGSIFLLTWAICIAIVIAAIVAFSVFHSTVNVLHSMLAGVLLTSAFAISYGGFTQFSTGRFATGPVAESPGPITAIAALHWMLAVSYLLCVIAVAAETPLYLDGQVPDNWAEALNLMVSVIALTGIGGLFITVHQERISRRHRDASLIDPLTGLSNRRALFERFPEGRVPQGAGLVVFDLDDFKGLNDRHGHAFGDTVLRSFARMMEDSCRGDTHALALAERIRRLMGRMIHTIDDHPVTCTVSAGVAVAEKPGLSLDTLIRKADNALYLSKRSGRNRVSQTTSTAA